jgi:hypothetical protein
MTGDERHVPTANPRLQPKGNESERILQDAFLTGGRDATGAGKLSAGTMSKALHDDEPQMFGRDDSWGSHSEEEGGPGEGGATGLWRRFRHFFSG